MTYTTILFDLDNTILSFDMAEEYALKKLFERENLGWDEEIFQIYHKKNKELWEGLEQNRYPRDFVLSHRFSYIFNYCGKQVDGGEMDKLFRQHLSEEIFFMPDAVEVLSTLQAQEKELYIVTNGVAVTQHKRISKGNLGRFFKDYFISEEIGHQKPAKDYFDHVVHHVTEESLDKLLIVGDSLSADIKGGNQAGIDTCWYMPEGKVEGEIQPKYHINQLKELFDII